jgi:energy-coupling factor transport system permease protein
VVTRDRQSLHALTFAAWAVAAASSVQIAPNPLYVAIVIGVAFLVMETHHRPGPLARAFPLLVTAGIVFALIRVVLTALTTHGTGHALMTLPQFTLPRLAGGFTVGGSIEPSVIAHTVAEGLVVVGVLAAFGAFNAAVSHAELVHSLPRAFYEVGLIVTVALAFVPSTIAAVSAVREADKARTGGRVVRRGRLVRQIVPVLETGLERAVALSESMDARGLGHHPPARAEAASAWFGLASLLALGAAFVALVGQATGWAVGLGATGLALVFAAIIAASRATKRTRYAPRPLTRVDWTVLSLSAAGPGALIVLALTGDRSLTWTTFPLAWPRAAVLPIVALLALAAPAAIVRRAA